MDDTYEQFLQKKIKDEHAYAHLIQQQASIYKDKYTKLLKQNVAVRKAENQLKMKNKILQQKLSEAHLQIKKLKQSKNLKIKELSEKRIKEQKSNDINPKQIFKQYIDNTFPKYKGMLKKIFKVLFILEEPHRLEPIAKIKFYEGLFNSFVKRILDWLIPKKTQSEKSTIIAEKLVQQWKKKQKQQGLQIKQTNQNIIKEGHYLQKIEGLEAELLIHKSKKSLLEGRIASFEKALQLKGVEIVYHLNKMLKKQQENFQSTEKIQQILTIINNIANHIPQKQKQGEQKDQKNLLEDIPLVISDKIHLQNKRKAAPILKKNIFGYYQDPQFNNNYVLPITTKHSNNNKQTQTLSQDLCVLTLHPVIMVTLIDGNIKPQRNRHSQQHYVKIKINDQKSITSSVKESFQPIWNQPFLMKDYDFPFMHVQLMHKSKGLRDSPLGGGKFTVNSSQEKIVNVRKQKQFIGRVRFSLQYPKGNIFQFKLTSVLLQIPQNKHILKEHVTISFPFNQSLQLDYALPQNIVYAQSSVIILQTLDDFMITQLHEQQRKGNVSLKEFIVKQGHKKIIVDLQEGWKVIIQGQVYLIICEDQQPQKIQQSLLQGGIGKYFSIRAPPPIITVVYNNISLHANIKFPLVFHLNEEVNKLSIIKQLYNRSVQQQIVSPIITPQGLLKNNQHLKNPPKIYKFFIQTLQGQRVYLKHESHLFERLLKQIHLQVSYKQDEAIQINYARKGKALLKQQPKYKQFTIESKDLILNHYKIFTKHFKKIGFVKFKLGYTIYDNLLGLEMDNAIKQSRKVIEKIKEGTYFLELQITQAHLQTMPNSSKYSCRIHNKQTHFKQSKHPSWKQTIVVSFEIQGKFEFQLQYQITEDNLFGKKMIYQGKILINSQVLRLACLIIHVDEQCKNCLHLSNINMPKQLYRFNIEQIRGQIQEQADWIGKIDPYLIIYSKNNELLRTQYLDNIGSHPIWKNIDKQLLISRQAEKQPSQILKINLFDYDILGKDDYLGTIGIDVKLNRQLADNSKIEKLYGNIVKDNTTCGSLHIIGSFQIISQQNIQLQQKSMPKLSKKDDIFKLFIYKIQILALKQYSKDDGAINIISKDQHLSSTNITYDQTCLSNLAIYQYILNIDSIIIELKRSYKSFFKVYEQILGKCSINIIRQGFQTGKIEIKTQSNKLVGYCYYYLQLLNKIRYATISDAKLCKSIHIQSDLNDNFDLSSYQSKKYIFYNKQLKFYQQLSDSRKQLQTKQIKQGVLWLYSNEQQHEAMISAMFMSANNIFQRKLQQTSERIPIQKDRRFYQLRYIHWQPFKYQPELQLELMFQLKQSSQSFSISKKLNSIFNQYIYLKQEAIPIIFDHYNSPSSITIRDKMNNKDSVIDLSQNQLINKRFVPQKGALYYELCNYNNKTVLQIEFQYLFIRLMSVKHQQNKDIMLRINNDLTVRSFISKPIGLSNEFLFSNISLLISQPPKLEYLFINFEIINSKQQILEVLKCGFKIQWNKKQYRIVINDQYMAHAYFTSVLIERHYEEQLAAITQQKGMSFIQLSDIMIDFYENQPNKCFIELSLLNQQQKMVLQSLDRSSFAIKNMKSLFFIQQKAQLQLLILQKGILKNTLLSTLKISLSQSNILKQSVTIIEQIKYNNASIGKLTLVYRNLEQMQYIDIDMYSYLVKDQRMKLVAKLDEFGHQDKYQNVQLTSKGIISRLESEDSFIVLNDPREYQINVSQKYSQKMLGQFKLCHQLNQQHRKIKVIQPLRTSSTILNGLLVLDYSKKKYSKKISQLQEQNKQQYPKIIELMFTNLSFKNQLKKTDDELLIKFNTPLRKNGMKTNISSDTFFNFIIYNTERCQLSLSIKDDIIGIAQISPPFHANQPLIITFYKQGIATGICLLTLKYLYNGLQKGVYREIDSLQVSKLINTQLFAKMNPYIQIQCQNNKNKYVSQLGLGKQHIFWKMNLIVKGTVKLVVKDKDLFYDDLIGDCSYQIANSLDKQDHEQQLKLTPGEDYKQNQSAGLLKIRTTFISEVNKDNYSPVLQPKQQIKNYILRLAQISPQYQQILKKTHSIQISMINKTKKIILMQENYNQPILYYISNKKYEILLNVDLLEASKGIQINVVLSNNKQIVFQQSLSDKNIKQKDLLFPVFDMIPVKQRYYALDQLYLWFDEKITLDTKIIHANKHLLSDLNIVKQQKRLIIAQNTQRNHVQSNESIYLIQQNRLLSQIIFKLNIQQLKVDSCIINGPIESGKKKIGKYYALIKQYYSQGEEYESTLYIGKSKKKWLYLTVCQALLTKDLQLFSKMDPYCKFAILNDAKEPQWYITSVQEDIGLHPIWNQDYFIPLFDQYQESKLKMIVFDSQVTIDRIIGQGQSFLNDLAQINNQITLINLFDNKKQPVGKVMMKLKVISHYIMFLNILQYSAFTKLQICCSKSVKNWIQVVEGIEYPLEEQTPLKIRANQMVFEYECKVLKGLKQRSIILKQFQIVLKYDMFD